MKSADGFILAGAVFALRCGYGLWTTNQQHDLKSLFLTSAHASPYFINKAANVGIYWAENCPEEYNFFFFPKNRWILLRCFCPANSQLLHWCLLPRCMPLGLFQCFFCGHLYKYPEYPCMNILNNILNYREQRVWTNGNSNFINLSCQKQLIWVPASVSNVLPSYVYPAE